MVIDFHVFKKLADLSVDDARIGRLPFLSLARLEGVIPTLSGPWTLMRFLLPPLPAWMLVVDKQPLVVYGDSAASVYSSVSHLLVLHSLHLLMLLCISKLHLLP
jgi:hypothetical protein